MLHLVLVDILASMLPITHSTTLTLPSMSLHTLTLLRTQHCAMLEEKSGDSLVGFADSSWGDQEDRHSTLGFVFLLANTATSWSSQKQKKIAQSTTEVELHNPLQGFKPSYVVQDISQGIGYEVSSLIPLHCDNKGAVDLAQNLITGRCSKHVNNHMLLGSMSKSKLLSLSIPVVRCWLMDSAKV